MTFLWPCHKKNFPSIWQSFFSISISCLLRLLKCHHFCILWNQLRPHFACDMFFWFFLMRGKWAFLSFPTYKSLWSCFPPAKAVRFCSVHGFGSYMLSLAFLSGFVTDRQHGLRDLFGMRPKNSFAEYSLTVSVGVLKKRCSGLSSQKLDMNEPFVCSGLYFLIFQMRKVLPISKGKQSFT